MKYFKRRLYQTQGISDRRCSVCNEVVRWPHAELRGWLYLNNDLYYMANTPSPGVVIHNKIYSVVRAPAYTTVYEAAGINELYTYTICGHCKSYLRGCNALNYGPLRLTTTIKRY